MSVLLFCCGLFDIWGWRKKRKPAASAEISSRKVKESMNDDEDHVNNLKWWDLPPQCAPDGRPWEAVDPEDVFLAEVIDIDDDPAFARFCQILRGERLSS